MNISYVILAAILLNSGCGGGPPTIVSMYSWEGIAQEKSAGRIPLRVMVAKLNDTRPEEEKIGEGKGKGFVASRDESLKNLLGQINEAMVKHLRQVELFADVQPASQFSSDLDDVRLLQLKNKADAVLVGNLGHFYGIVYRDRKAMERKMGMAIAGGPIGALVMFGAESTVTKEVEGHVTLTDLKLIDLKSSKSLWEGSVEGHFRREQKGLPGPSDIAVEALKEAVGKLVKQLRDIKARAGSSLDAQ